ncbi:hypothetical protein H106_01401 [Trichophyton rubrum CBS 735.88]|nr:hypothetical protein H100_01630 [Trichophyton rubrum MR850]EZF87741.1 hypothetical protein H110_01634 [Trichophyton rubrum MR1448]EZG09507.1 hypothetical protein H106_01401 [Trichophyton rubrum CBS 735.88]
MSEGNWRGRAIERTNTNGRKCGRDWDRGVSFPLITLDKIWRMTDRSLILPCWPHQYTTVYFRVGRDYGLIFLPLSPLPCLFSPLPPFFSPLRSCMQVPLLVLWEFCWLTPREWASFPI